MYISVQEKAKRIVLFLFSYSIQTSHNALRNNGDSLHWNSYIQNTHLIQFPFVSKYMPIICTCSEWAPEIRGRARARIENEMIHFPPLPLFSSSLIILSISGSDELNEHQIALDLDWMDSIEVLISSSLLLSSRS
jgi:hypothetical protein